ncbi:hypothetical protein H2O73_21210 [Vibrio sp. 404]|uniref:Uncharacterized protein n=1 Tax=Vibrio marinisediminis TaxID=2758441 RepID=A0A7W2IVQ4_9VIBR|nr:hypothetical protein [Vibrio marinisediminis]
MSWNVYTSNPTVSDDDIVETSGPKRAENGFHISPHIIEENYRSLEPSFINRFKFSKVLPRDRINEIFPYLSIAAHAFT